MARLVQLLALGLLLAACSLIVGGETEPLRCSQEGHTGAPACDAGWTCHAGLCEPAEAGGSPAGQGGAASSQAGTGGAAGAAGAQ